VLIGGQPCSRVNLTDPVFLSEFSCVAPAGPGAGPIELVVAVEDAPTASVPFLYAAPAVTRVTPSPSDATVAVTIVIHGTNLGLRSAVDPEITVGRWSSPGGRVQRAGWVYFLETHSCRCCVWGGGLVDPQGRGRVCP
jgi:hypothetical protein